MQKKLFIKYYNDYFPLAKPPFSVGEVKSKEIMVDKIFPLISDTTFFILLINKKGIYQILENENTENGMSILAFENDFPKTTFAKDMITPLKYICTNEEFLQLNEIKNQKIAKNKFIRVKYRKGFSSIKIRLNILLLDLDINTKIKLIKITKIMKGSNFFIILFYLLPQTTIMIRYIYKKKNGSVVKLLDVSNSR